MSETGSLMASALSSEAAVLGSLMKPGKTPSRERFVEVSGLITREDFSLPRHQKIWGAMESVVAAGGDPDPMTIWAEISRGNPVCELADLIELAEHAPSSHSNAYGRQLAESSALLRLRAAGEQIQNLSGSPSEAASEANRLLNEAIRAVPGLTGQFKTLSEITAERLQTLDKVANSDSGLLGRPTGIQALDDRHSGWEGGSLIVLAARPAMGKTALAMFLASVQEGDEAGQSLVYSLEMAEGPLADRELSRISGVSSDSIRKPKLLSNSDWQQLANAHLSTQNYKMLINFNTGIKPSRIRAQAGAVLREHGKLGLIVVDYLQLMHADGKNDREDQKYADISQELKEIAKEFDVPVIALAQLNRSVETRPNRRPLSSDLRGSGGIEQAADCIGMIYRECVYTGDTTSPYKDLMELIWTKTRQGSIGTDYFHADLARYRFTTWDESRYPIPPVGSDGVYQLGYTGDDEDSLPGSFRSGLYD